MCKKEVTTIQSVISWLPNLSEMGHLTSGVVSDVFILKGGKNGVNFKFY